MNDVQNSLSLPERLRLHTPTMALFTIIFGLVGAGVFVLIYAIEMPFIMISLFKFGLAPALAIIAVVGGLRGPLAGFLTGYLGIILYDFIFFGTVVMLTLPAFSYGVLGLIVGLPSYDLTKGRSLAKMSVLSAIGLVFTALLVVVFDLTIVHHSILIALGFVLLPLMTVGLPSVILITPILARIWATIYQQAPAHWQSM
ncbi:MAG: hypothetical protein JW779_04950 [Candidatus Thorarchaeota archaeon]|nr:hypothetical protein [Candidatus Thorarchaeota archaeon]